MHDSAISHRAIGFAGEKIAENYLRDLNYAILRTNFYSRYGEIDLIAKKQDAIIFIEVKNYKANSLVDPKAMITLAKQKKLIKTAKYFLYTYNLIDVPAQFDVIIVENQKIKEHLENAISL